LSIQAAPIASGTIDPQATMHAITGRLHYKDLGEFEALVQEEKKESASFSPQ